MAAKKKTTSESENDELTQLLADEAIDEHALSRHLLRLDEQMQDLRRRTAKVNDAAHVSTVKCVQDTDRLREQFTQVLEEWQVLKGTLSARARELDDMILKNGRTSRKLSDQVAALERTLKDLRTPKAAIAPYVRQVGRVQDEMSEVKAELEVWKTRTKAEFEKRLQDDARVRASQPPGPRRG